MRISQRTAVLVLFLLGIIPAVVFAQDRGRLVGKITDEQGNGIPGVTVTVTSPDVPSFHEVLTTDKRGIFTVDFRQVDVKYHYRFEKAGLQPLEFSQLWQKIGTAQQEWKMQAGSAPTVGGALPASTSEPAVAAFNAGISAFKAKDYATAETKFKEAVQHDPKLVQGWSSLSAVQLANAHYQDAAASAEQAMALGDNSEATLTSRYQAYRNLKDNDKAAAALKDLEKVGRRAEEAKKIHNEAVALAKAGDNAGALTKFQEALTVDPNLQASQIGLATAALKLGRNAEAATAAEAVLKNDPKNDQALRLRYNACLALGDKPRLFDALVGLSQVERVAAVKGMMQLAFEAYDANDAAQAKERFTKIIEIDPKQAVIHYYLAMVCVNQGQTDEARKHLEDFLQLVPTGKEADTAREMLKALKK